MPLRITPPTPKPCADCGSSPTFHSTAWIESILGLLANGRTKDHSPRTHSPTSRLEKAFIRQLPYIFRAMKKVGLAEITSEADERDFKWTTEFLFMEAKHRGITLVQLRPFGLVIDLFHATKGNAEITFERLPLPKETDRGAPWIDDKGALKKILQKHDVATPHGSAHITLHKALRAFHGLTKPVIVKPGRGSGSRHTTLHIHKVDEFIEAFKRAKKLSLTVMVEEEMSGAVYRPTVVGGKLIATLKREQPFVVGNGVASVRELIEKENQHPKREGPMFSKISISDEVIKELERQGLTPESILPHGKKVQLHQKINWSVGGTTTDVTNQVHKENRMLFEAIAKLAGAPIIGIDFIIDDISKSWREQERCGVIECNSLPFFDNHHLPFHGEPQDVVGAIWEQAFPGSEK